MHLPGIMTSPIYETQELAIAKTMNHCTIGILELQNLHWDKDRSTIPSSWYFQTFKSPKSLHIDEKRPGTYHMWATSWLWVVATCFFACRSAFFGSRRNAFVRPVIKPQFSIAPSKCMAGINDHCKHITLLTSFKIACLEEDEVGMT